IGIIHSLQDDGDAQPFEVGEKVHVFLAEKAYGRLGPPKTNTDTICKGEWSCKHAWQGVFLWSTGLKVRYKENGIILANNALAI
ncbi:hypothetical protein ACJX0J_034544, partial [Zea mays]